MGVGDEISEGGVDRVSILRVDELRELQGMKCQVQAARPVLESFLWKIYFKRVTICTSGPGESQIGSAASSLICVTLWARFLAHVLQRGLLSFNFDWAILTAPN
ncbi:hypothetical protein VNO77_22752 [Canavalia gladiata]|uniref:Uncharacterized protein n=1 Tax=Canavalia gladiata TaxID=3824 RepID=A0AAN9QER5_CANGL